MSDCLHRIGMENCIVLFTDLTRCINIQQVPDLIIGMHQAHEATLRPDSELSFKVFQVNMSIG